ncbi:MAG: lysophospholipid acyltransferase family protein [Candidatus Saccharibacteria bacterium]
MSKFSKFTRLFRKAERELESDIKAEEKKIVEFVRYEETRLARFLYMLLRKIAAPLIRFLWLSEVEGLHNIPKEGPVIIALNHESYFDFLCISAVLDRRLHFLAAEKFFDSRLWRPLMRVTGQIKVNRKHPDKSKVFEQVYYALEDGRAIGIFPEGTRSHDGKLQKAYSGVGRIALTAKAPIVPVGLIGTYEIMSRHDKFPKLKKAKIKIGEPMHFKEFHDINHDESHYRHVTDTVMNKIGEMVNEAYPQEETKVIEGKVVQ